MEKTFFNPVLSPNRAGQVVILFHDRLYIFLCNGLTTTDDWMMGGPRKIACPQIRGIYLLSNFIYSSVGHSKSVFFFTFSLYWNKYKISRFLKLKDMSNEEVHLLWFKRCCVLRKCVVCTLRSCNFFLISRHSC